MTKKEKNKKAHNLKFIAISLAIVITCSLGFHYLMQEGHNLPIQSKKPSQEELVPENTLKAIPLNVKNLDGDSVEKEHKEAVSDNIPKNLGQFNATMSKTVFTVHDKLNLCNMHAMLFMFREQRILLPQEKFSPKDIEEMNIYYGNDESILSKSFSSVKQFREYAKSNLSENNSTILENGYFKFGKKEGIPNIKSFPKAGPHSNDHYLSLNATNMPGKSWPSVVVVEYKQNNSNSYNYLITMLADASNLKNPPKVMPFSLHLEDGLIVTKGVAELKGNYSVNYEALYEHLAPRTYIQEVNGDGKENEVVFELPHPEQITHLDVMYDINPGEYNINFDSQYKITLFDNEDPFFKGCDPEIKGFERIGFAKN